jgi:hypothetical protein
LLFRCFHLRFTFEFIKEVGSALKMFLINKFIKEIIIITFMFKTFINVMNRNTLKFNIYFISLKF